MQPQSLALPVQWLNQVMPDIQPAFPGRIQRRHHPMSNKGAIGCGPAERLIVLLEIIRCRRTGGIKSLMTMLVDDRAQDGFAKTTGTAVDQEQQAVRVDVQRRQCCRIQHLRNGLNFGKMVAAADGAERSVESCGFQVE